MEFLSVGSGRVQHGVRRGALLRRFAAVGVFAFSEQGDGFVPVLHLGQRDGLQDVPADEVFQIGDADVGAVHRGGLRQEAVEQIALFRRLHGDRETQVFRRLFGNGRNGGDRRAGMAEHDILDVLCPDGGEAGQGARTGGGADGGGGAFQQAAA